MKRVWRFAALQFVYYGLNAISFRYLARGSYVGLALSDAALACWTFSMIRHVANADGWREQVGYTLGGIAGSLLGLWLTT